MWWGFVIPGEEPVCVCLRQAASCSTFGGNGAVCLPLSFSVLPSLCGLSRRYNEGYFVYLELSITLRRVAGLKPCAGGCEATEGPLKRAHCLLRYL